MTSEEKRDEKYRLLCEKVVNETWSEVEKLTDEIERVLEKTNLNNEDISLLRIASHAFVQRVTLDKSNSVALFEVDLFNDKDILTN